MASLLRSLLLAALLLPAACAIPFGDPRFQERQAGLVQAALRPVDEAPAEPRLWYIGIGLYGESWSENDVAEVATRLRNEVTGFRVVPIVFSSRFRGLPERFPMPDRQSVERATEAIARRARPEDVVLVYVSSHGSPGRLARQAGGLALEPVNATEIREWLAPLEAQNTVLVLSACFSGSLIPGLRADNRIIFTAARANRTSFGCKAGAQHTVFGEAFLDALAEPHASLQTIVDKTRREVDVRERNQGLSPPSDPQLFVGSRVARLYDEPAF